MDLKKLDRKITQLDTTYPVKIIQVGEGNFLRAFVDWIVDKLNEKTDFNGAVKIVQPIPKGMVQTLNNQDGLYHVILQGVMKGEDVSEKRLIQSVYGGINPYDDYQEFLKLAENPELQMIVSNTTEAGIAFDEGDKTSDTLPNSYPGKLTALLYHRFDHFSGESDKGLIIIPCELIEKNGEHLKNYVLKYAGYWDLGEEFIRWVKENVVFCNSLVDRIVPGYPSDKADEFKKELGFDDKMLVSAEYFHLWVIEGPDWIKEKFPVHKANLNIKFVDNLLPYRRRKVRILNGIHTSMVPVGYLYGLSTVRESIDNDVVGSFLSKALHEEIIPTLDLTREELTEFANAVLDRFRNPFIKHQLISIALNSISKYKVRVLPSVLKYYEINNELPKRLLFSLAALIRFYKGDRNGEEIPLNDSDDIIILFSETWKLNDYQNITQTILGNKKLWEQNLNEVDGMTDLVSCYLKEIDTNGIETALSKINT